MPNDSMMISIPSTCSSGHFGVQSNIANQRSVDHQQTTFSCLIIMDPCRVHGLVHMVWVCRGVDPGGGGGDAPQ